jgi:D-alanyl-D-alanine carboxypeptidase (penicillin-binding protein 5/6)
MHRLNILWNGMRLSFVTGVFICISHMPLKAFESEAPYAYLYDIATSTVLYAKEAEKPIEPGSMTQLATMSLVFDLLEDGKLQKNAVFNVSETAWRQGGAPSGNTTMYARVNNDVPLMDLMRGMAVMSAHDAAIAIGEGIDGSENAFVSRLNRYAVNLGLNDTSFQNASGREAEGHRTTAQDMARLALYVLENHSVRLGMFALPAFEWNRIFQRTKNTLINDVEGVDGFKTGTSKNGFGMIGTASRNGRRIVFFVHGLDTSEGRSQEAQRLIDHAYNDFKLVKLADEGEAIAQASVYGGAESTVGLVSEKGALNILLPSQGRSRVRARVEYAGPLIAPVKANMQAGRLIVERDGLVIQETPLKTQQNVEKGSLTTRAGDGLQELMFGWIPHLTFNDLMDMVK